MSWPSPPFLSPRSVDLSSRMNFFLWFARCSTPTSDATLRWCCTSFGLRANSHSET